MPEHPSTEPALENNRIYKMKTTYHYKMFRHPLHGFHHMDFQNLGNSCSIKWYPAGHSTVPRHPHFIEGAFRELYVYIIYGYYMYIYINIKYMYIYIYKYKIYVYIYMKYIHRILHISKQLSEAGISVKWFFSFKMCVRDIFILVMYNWLANGFITLMAVQTSYPGYKDNWKTLILEGLIRLIAGDGSGWIHEINILTSKIPPPPGKSI